MLGRGSAFRTALVWLAAAGLALAATQLQSWAFQQVRDGARLEVLEDAAGRLTIDEILTPGVSTRFEPVEGIPSYGFTSSAYWFRIVLAAAPDTRVLEVANPTLSRLELYRLQADGTRAKTATGSAHPLSSREVLSPAFAFRHPGSSAEVTYLLRVQSVTPVRVPIQLWTEDEFDAAERLRSLVNGFFYGGIVFAAAFQVLLAIVTRYHGFVLFVVALLAAMISLLGLDGYGPLYLWPALAGHSRLINVAASSVTIATLLVFTSSVLMLRARRPRLNAAVLGMAGGVALLGLPLERVLAGQLLFTSAFLLMVGVGVLSWRDGFAPARTFVIAWVVLLVGVFTGMLLYAGVPLRFPFGSDLLYKAAALPAIAILSASLFNRVSVIRQAGEDAQAALRRHDEILVSIARGVVGASGAAVFESLVEHMARAFDADVALIGELTDEGDRVRTVAVWRNGRPADQFEYLLEGAPCEHIVRQGPCVYPREVARQFPRDQVLSELRMEGYAGTPLVDAQQRTIGLVACLFCKGIAEEAMISRTLQIFAARASSELERRRAERTLAEQEALLRGVLDSSPAVIYAKDRAGRYLLVNREFARRAKLPREAIVGQTDAQLFQADAATQFGRHDQSVLSSVESIQFEEREGPYLYLSTKVALRHEDGTPWALVGVSTDITEFDRLQAQVRAAQRMEAVGQLAGGVAHDFNNLLTAVLGYIDMCESVAEPDSALARDLQLAREAGMRAARITDQLLTFARRQRSSPQVADLHEVVRDLEHLLKQGAGAAVALRLELSNQPAPVRIDVGQFEQVLLNLVLNARDAMPGGGCVTIRSVVSQATRGEGPRTGGYVRLVVRDTGVGVAPELLPRIFEPFFTTKPPGQGTGLGLAMSHGIVSQAGGTIEVESEPGFGSTFTVVLPLSSMGIPRPALEPPPSALGGRETVLLVDDEGAVLAFVSRVLRAKGYHVLEAHDGPAALDTASRHAGPIHLLLTDVAMPNLNGREVADRLRHERPDSAVLYMSGYAERALAQDGLTDDGAGFLPKPFTMAELTSAVREALDRDTRTCTG
jgi:PAS domain S-box-containing protein